MGPVNFSLEFLLTSASLVILPSHLLLSTEVLLVNLTLLLPLLPLVFIIFLPSSVFVLTPLLFNPIRHTGSLHPARLFDISLVAAHHRSLLST